MHFDPNTIKKMQKNAYGNFKFQENNLKNVLLFYILENHIEILSIFYE